MKETSEAESRLQSIDAYLTFIEAGTEAGLRALAESTEPDIVESRLRVLIESDRFEDARNVVIALPPHEQWCTQAFIVLARQGDFQGADQLFGWVQQQHNPVLRGKCAVAFAGAAYARAVVLSGGEDRLFPDLIAPESVEVLSKALRALGPVLHGVEANEGVETLLQERAVVIALVASHCMGDEKAAGHYATLLKERTPVPLDLARAVLHRRVPSPPDLPERLRAEHRDGPEVFEARLAAAVVESLVLGRVREGFSAALELVTEAPNSTRGQALLQALREISSHVDENAVKVVEALGPVLAKDDEPLQVLLRAEGLLRRGETEEAKALLEQVGPSDDPMWLQLYAGALIQAGRRKEALTHLLRASAQLPHPALLRQTAMLANSEGQPEDAERILREAIARERGDLEARELLALILTQRGAFREAAAEFEALAHLEQGGFRHQINRAISLVHAGDHAGALSLYDELCAKSDAPLVAVLGRATVLRSLGRVGEAFRGLARERGRFWSDPQFLTCLVDVGFAAGEEASAHEAFVELVRQKKEGLLPPGIIEEASLEDLKSRIAGFQKRREELGESVLGGRVPWLLVDRLLGRASYWAWGIRTQPLNWVYEQRVNLAEATVYATNGYTVVKDEESGETELRNTQCPGKGAKVVVDWTALITLHRLGLLRHAVDYFDKLFIPLTYRRHALEEGSRLVPHQLSHVRAVDAIHSLIEEQRIGVLGETNGADPEYEIDEYAEATPGRPRCSFHELFRALYELGVIPQTEVDRLSKAAPANSSQNAPLGAGKEIFVALSSLEGLSQLGVLDVVARTFHLYVDRAAIEELRSRRRVLRFQEQVRSLHGELWQFVQANPKVAELPATSAPPPASERVRNEPSIDAVRVAQTAGLPLFVDDRYCQAVVLNARSTVPDAAFGIGDFLRALQEGDSAERRLLGNAWHQLLTWRYRFLIPPSDVVLEWAAEYRGNLPGEKLRELARYAHDAVSDPGLFAGRETTTNPSTIAIRYYQDWIGTAAEVIAGVWGNTAFADSQAESFTRWMVTRLLPPPPATLPPRDQGVLLALLAKSLVGRLSIYCAPLPTSERARSAVHSAARSLGLSHEELERLIVDTIDAI